MDGARRVEGPVAEPGDDLGNSAIIRTFETEPAPLPVSRIRRLRGDAAGSDAAVPGLLTTAARTRDSLTMFISAGTHRA
jgi:hypothetical protein